MMCALIKYNATDRCSDTHDYSYSTVPALQVLLFRIYSCQVKNSTRLYNRVVRKVEVFVTVLRAGQSADTLGVNTFGRLYNRVVQKLKLSYLSSGRVTLPILYECRSGSELPIIAMTAVRTP